MTPPASPYGSVISARSRRLRTIMTVLLAIIALMSVFGFYKLMPLVRDAVGRPDTPALTRIAHSQPGPDLTVQQIAHAKRTLHARQVSVFMALAYWGVCSLLIVGILLLAWLDFRETTRSFVTQARALREDTVATLQEDIRRSRTRRDTEDG